MDKFQLFGGSGHAKVIADCIDANGGVVIGIFDDNPELKMLDSIPVIGRYDSKNQNFPVIVSVGDNRLRKNISQKIEGEFFKINHPSAIINSNVKIGIGSVILHGAILQSNSAVGEHCIVNTGAQIDHDCTIEDFVHVSPNATLCGNVQIGEGTHIGAASVVIQGVKIGKWVQIGAGAVIIEDIPDFAVVVGNPGKIIKYNK